jgi:RIO-like serine/threonine protein kinase
MLTPALCVPIPPAAIKVINGLHRNKLIYHERKVYDGYRLTYLGYDFLALHTYVARGLITALGRRIGVGKEADIYECANEKGESMVIKLHRSVIDSATEQRASDRSYDTLAFPRSSDGGHKRSKIRYLAGRQHSSLIPMS